MGTNRIRKSVFIALFLLVALSLMASYNEAPMLSEMVKNGTLPSVDQRLPENPLVIEPVEEIGVYGGTWRYAEIVKGGETSFMPLCMEPLIRWNIEGNDIIPNIAEKWTISDDAQEFTFFLKEGIKWSDGVDFSADDIMFWYNDILRNEELNPSVSTWLKTLVDLVKIDDYTIKFVFSSPNPLFLENIAFQDGGRPTTMIQPAHYLKNFHPNYVSEDKLAEMYEKESYDNWYTYFKYLYNFRLNPEVPTVNAWILKESGNEQLLERNPYYWKVDTAGNQLPYIDKAIIEVVLNTETLTMKAVAGELDFQPFRLSLADYTLFKENEAKGDYRLLTWGTALGSNLGIMPNLNHEDPFLNELFNNKDFRVALSLAINREEINEIGYLGLAEPRAATIIEGCPYYVDGLAELHAQFDPEMANEILDQIGLDKKSKDGYRLNPDGEEIDITILTTDMTLYGPWVDITDLVSRYWSEIGIKTSYEVLSSTLYSQRRKTTGFDVITWAYGRGLHPLINPVFLFPVLNVTGAPLYSLWYTSDGEKGVEPPAEMRELMELYEVYSTTADDDERLAIGKEIVSKSTDNCWIIGSVGEAPTPMVVKNNFRNVPENALYEFILQHITHTHPEQYFIK